MKSTNLIKTEINNEINYIKKAPSYTYRYSQGCTSISVFLVCNYTCMYVCYVVWLLRTLKNNTKVFYLMSFIIYCSNGLGGLLNKTIGGELFCFHFFFIIMYIKDNNTQLGMDGTACQQFKINNELH